MSITPHFSGAYYLVGNDLYKGKVSSEYVTKKPTMALQKLNGCLLVHFKACSNMCKVSTFMRSFNVANRTCVNAPSGSSYNNADLSKSVHASSILFYIGPLGRLW